MMGDLQSTELAESLYRTLGTSIGSGQTGGGPRNEALQ